MNWPWTRNQRHEEERQALEEAHERLAEVRGQWPRVEAAVESLRKHKERNHFGESIAAIYAGRRP